MFLLTSGALFQKLGIEYEGWAPKFEHEGISWNYNKELCKISYSFSFFLPLKMASTSNAIISHSLPMVSFTFFQQQCEPIPSYRLKILKEHNKSGRINFSLQAIIFLSKW